MTVLLSVTDLRRSIGRRHILRGVAFEAGGGEVVAVVGRNGAGKTTLLSLLAGRQAPDDGSVTLDGFAIGTPEYRAMVGFLPHDLFVYPDLTAAENLAFFATLHGSRDSGAAATAALQEVGLGPHAARLVRSFSRGMQQRLAIGRLLVGGARVWLMDEPATGLDAPGREWLGGMLRARGQAGRLLIFATHERGDVAGVATRVLVMEGGRLAMDRAGGEEGADAAFARLV